MSEQQDYPTFAEIDARNVRFAMLIVAAWFVCAWLMLIAWWSMERAAPQPMRVIYLASEQPCDARRKPRTRLAVTGCYPRRICTEEAI